MSYQRLPMTVPIYLPGQEPLPPGFTDEDRAALAQQQKYQQFFAAGAESCVAKTAIAGVGGARVPTHAPPHG
jgi:import inner membrane translocase subunit TIM22